MSGGHWNYVGFRLQDGLQEIASDESVQRRWPRIAGAFNRLANALYAIEHDMDWDLCSDSAIENDGAWQAEAMDRLQRSLLDPEPPIA